MISFLYNVAIFIGSCIWFIVKKNKRQSIISKTTLKDFKNGWSKLSPSKEVLWVHAPSLGEVNSSFTIIDKIREQYNVFICLSTVTRTGYNSAINSNRFDYVFYMPIDYSWNMSGLYKLINPKLLLIVESDFWWNLLRFANFNNVPSVLINGKVSSLSMRRFQWFSFFSKLLFSNITKICAQDDENRSNFLNLGISSDKVIVTRNLKYDQKVKRLSDEEKNSYYKILTKKKVITLASTHEGEEELIFDKMKDLWQYHDFCCLLAPRHPDRFETVYKLVESKGLDITLWSEKRPAKVVLIDSMGLLGICYELSIFAILGGSYKKCYGGHNVIEPNFYDTPSFFGPYMHKQMELKQKVLRFGSGDVLPLEDMKMELNDLLKNSDRLKRMKLACKKCIDGIKGSSKLTYDQLEPYLKKYYETGI